MGKIIKELRDTLKDTQSSPFLFIGSGFSRRYLDLPDWKGLLSQLATDAHPDSSEYAFQLYKNRLNVGTVPPDQLLPLIAKEIEKDYTDKFLVAPEFEELRNRNKELISNDVSCLKIGAAEFFKKAEEKFSTPNHLDEIEALEAIKGKVAGIITTNHDTFLESIFDKFETYIGQDELLFSRIYDVCEIYKIHGCCTAPESLVVTSDDYARFNQKNAYLAAKLLTTFLEHPIIFIGYSLNDANIKMILNDIVQCLNDEQLKKLSKRLFFVLRETADRPEAVIRREKEFTGRPLEVTEIVRANFSDVYNTLAKSTPRYEPMVLRNLKKDIYELVLNNDPKGRLHVLNIDDTENMPNVDYVLGIGAWQAMGDEGYVSLEPADLFEDLLYDNRKYNVVKIVNKVLPKLMKGHGNSIPVFKYIKNFEGELPVKLVEYINGLRNYDSLLCLSIKQRPAISAKSIGEVKGGYDLEVEKGVERCLWDIVKLKEAEIDTEKLHDLLIEIYGHHPDIFTSHTVKPALKTHFRRALKIYDWLKYKKKAPALPSETT